MAESYPLDSIQYLLSELNENWWESSSPDQEIRRGDLVRAFVPHVDQIPFGVRPSGRPVATEHSLGVLEVEAIRIGLSMGRRRPDLPVAAMTLHAGEWWAAYRAKKRPCLVVAEPGDLVLDRLRRGMPQNSTAPTLLVAPYYGVDKDGTRAGYNERFVDAAKHGELRQFMVDRLPPPGGPSESILRFDQLQPVGFSNQSCEKLGYRLSDAALGIIDEWVQWYLWDNLDPNGWIQELRNYIKSVSEST